MSFLVLTITSKPSGVDIVQMRKLFKESGGTIGRASSNAWYLPDPKNLVSKQHACIRFYKGKYLLVDMSSNGVLVNDNAEPLGRDEELLLKQGDSLRIGDYHIAVTFESVMDTTEIGASEEGVPYSIKEYTIRPLWEAITIGLCAFLVVFVTTSFIYYHALNAQKGEIREGIARTATILTQFVDGDLHRTFLSSEQEDSDAYKRALSPFGKAMDADGSIAFIYTGILKDNKVFFILDPTPEGDSDGDGVDDKAHIMEEYPEAAEEMIAALKDKKVVVSDEPYTDRWGSFFSAYAPFYDSKGVFVGVLGIDISADNYFERLAPIKRATVRAEVAGFFVSFMVGALVWFMRNFASIINRSRIQMYKDLVDRYNKLAKKHRASQAPDEDTIIRHVSE